MQMTVNNVKKSTMRNNWPANRVWNKIEDKKVIIAIYHISPLVTTS